jgi:hypothetical protein
VKCQVKRTPKFREGVRRLPSVGVGNAIRSQVEVIEGDPVKATRGHSQGFRVRDGNILSDGKSYYFQIVYTHVEGSGEVTLHQLRCQESSGPH